MGAGVGVGARKDINIKDLITIRKGEIQDTQEDKDCNVIKIIKLSSMIS